MRFRGSALLPHSRLPSGRCTESCGHYCTVRSHCSGENERGLPALRRTPRRCASPFSVWLTVLLHGQSHTGRTHWFRRRADAALRAQVSRNAVPRRHVSLKRDTFYSAGRWQTNVPVIALLSRGPHVVQNDFDLKLMRLLAWICTLSRLGIKRRHFQDLNISFTLSVCVLSLGHAF